MLRAKMLRWCKRGFSLVQKRPKRFNAPFSNLPSAWLAGRSERDRCGKLDWTGRTAASLRLAAPVVVVGRSRLNRTGHFITICCAATARFSRSSFASNLSRHRRRAEYVQTITHACHLVPTIADKNKTNEALLEPFPLLNSKNNFFNFNE